MFELLEITHTIAFADSVVVSRFRAKCFPPKKMPGAAANSAVVLLDCKDDESSKNFFVPLEYVTLEHPWHRDALELETL